MALLYSPKISSTPAHTGTEIGTYLLLINVIVSAARSLTCRDDLDSKWRLLLAENELSRVSLLSRILSHRSANFVCDNTLKITLNSSIPRKLEGSCSKQHVIMLDFASVFIATSTVSSTQEISSTPPHTGTDGGTCLLLIDVICV